MKTCSLVYEGEKKLEEFIKNHEIKNHENTLLQIFTSSNEQETIQNFLDIVKKYLPSIKIIGCTTAGEILDGKSLENSTIFSFSIFEKTTVKTSILSTPNNCHNLGKDIMKPFSKEDLQNSNILISFASGLKINADEYLKGINSIDKNITISGGLAADKYQFKKTYVFNENEIYEDGAIAALLVNKDLKVFTNYNYNWKAIGKSHIVKKASKNRIYEVDDMSAVDFYKYYLGENLYKRLPRIGIEFPIIIQNKSIDIARVVLSTHDDGSITVGGNIEEGSEIKIGFGNTQSILEETINDVNNLNEKEIESLFIYSCGARKELLEKYVDYELQPYSKILGTHSGFFTYGEFYRLDSGNELLNQTMTILGLSEDTKKLNFKKQDFKNPKVDDESYEFYKIQALSRIVKITSDELENLNKNLEDKVALEVANSRKKDMLLEANFKYAQMGEIIDMIVHQFRQPLNVLSSVVSSLKFQSEHTQLDSNYVKESLNILERNIHYSNDTIGDFRTFFKPNIKEDFVKPSEIIKKTLTLINTLFIEHNIKLEKSIEFDEEISLNTSKMMQVLMNLIKNTIDEIKLRKIEDPLLIIRTYEDKNSYYFEVEDNAGGISDEVLPKIFDKGFTTKSKFDGTGIGLDMSKSIVQDHLGGEIFVKNSKNGAVFTIKITF